MTPTAFARHIGFGRTPQPPGTDGASRTMGRAVFGGTADRDLLVVVVVDAIMPTTLTLTLTTTRKGMPLGLGKCQVASHPGVATLPKVPRGVGYW